MASHIDPFHQASGQAQGLLWRNDGGPEVEAMLLEQSVAMGVSEEEAAYINAALLAESIGYKEVFGLTQNEMDAMVMRANDWLRRNEPQQALKIFLALLRLDRFTGAYWRGAAMALHHMQQFAFAHAYYSFAIASTRRDAVSELLRAECLFHLEAPQTACEALRGVLAKGAFALDDAIYVDRARALLACAER